MSNTTSTPATGPAAVAADYRLCADGCGQQVVGKAIFRPGHDARFVSLLVAKAAEDGFSFQSRNEGEDALPTAALRLKFGRAFDNAHARAEAKANRAERRATQRTEGKVYRTLDATGMVKVGRWEYPARRWVRNASGEFWFERNTKRDGSGEWVDASNGGADDGSGLTSLEGSARVREDITAWYNTKAA